MASSKEIHRILTRLQTRFLEQRPETLSSSPRALNDFLSSVRNHSLLSSPSSSSPFFLAEWLKLVHSFLRSSSDHRLLGLRLLTETVRQCSTDVFKAHCASWFRQLYAIVFAEASPSAEEARSLALDCLARVIAHSASLPECAREMTAKENVPQLVVSLIGLDRDLTRKGGLDCLVACARSYPGATGSVGKGKLEKKSVEILEERSLGADADDDDEDDEDDASVSEAALFFALLPKLGGAGVAGARFRQAWESQFTLLLGTLNDVVDDLFQGVVHLSASNNNNNDNDADSSIPSQPRLPLKAISDEDDARPYRLLNRFRVLCACLKSMLSTNVGVSVRIPLTRILSFVFRLCNVTPSSLTFKPTNESLILASILPELYAASLGVLRGLLKTAGNRLFNHGLSVNRLILQMLRCTALKEEEGGGIYGSDSRFQKCRGRVYDFLSAWLRVYPSIETGTKGDSALKWIAHVLADARPPEAETATLKTSERARDGKRGGGGGGGSKARKKTKGSLFESASVTSDRKIDHLANARVCASALKAASAMVLTRGRVLPPEVHKALVEFSVPLAQSISLRDRTHLPPPIPFASSECRLALFQLLKCLLLNPSPKWPPPLAAVSAVFRRGVGDSDESVRHFCVEANVVVANLVHPRVHPVQMPIVIPKDLEESVSRERKREVAAEDESVEATKKGKSNNAEDRCEPRTSEKVTEKSGDAAAIDESEPIADEEESSIEVEPTNDAEGRRDNEKGEKECGNEEEEEEENEEEEKEGKLREEGEEEKSKVESEKSDTDDQMDLSFVARDNAAENLDSPFIGHSTLGKKRPLETDESRGADEGGYGIDPRGDQRRTEARKGMDGDEDEDPELEAMLRDFNPDADPDPV